jgi:glutathione synthase/RimK-type ligase-like ATP-grasp enzyme
MEKKLKPKTPTTYHRLMVHSHHESHQNFNFPSFSKRVNIYFGEAPEKTTDISFNTHKGISNCHNKLTMKTIFQKSKIPSPNFSMKLFPSYPQVIKRVRHSRGEGMQLLEKECRIAPNKDQYFEEFVECEDEYRCHVIGDCLFHVDKKTLRPGHSESWIKNLSNYKYVETPIRKAFTVSQCKTIIRSVKCLGLVFGAVDVGVCADGKLCIFEVNSAPGMRTLTRKKYEEAISKYIVTNYKIRKKNV